MATTTMTTTMTHAEIKRSSLAVLSSDSLVAGLLTEAEEVLGYSAKKALIKNGEEVAEMPLASALARLEMDVLDKADVEKYKKEHLKEVAARTFAAWMTSDSSWYSIPTWMRTKIDEYKEPIPEFVLDKAIQIKKAVPDVAIFVEWLNESPDPFLVVCTQTQRESGAYKYSEDVEAYYVEAWDEPKFEGRLR